MEGACILKNSCVPCPQFFCFGNVAGHPDHPRAPPLLDEDKLKTLPSGATVKGTTQYYHYKSCGKPGLLLRRKYPCLCSACLNDDSTNCSNASWSSKWEEVAVKAK